MNIDALKELRKMTGKKMTVGNFLWTIRMCDEESQTEFAKKLGISSQYLCDLERGRKLLSPKKAKEFAEKLGYLPQQFIELAIQDMLEHDGIHMIVQIKEAA